MSFLRATALYAIARICDRPSGRLSGRLSVTPVDCTKTVEVRIMQLPPQGSPMTLVSSRSTSRQNSKGNLGSGGAK